MPTCKIWFSLQNNPLEFLRVYCESTMAIIWALYEQLNVHILIIIRSKQDFEFMIIRTYVLEYLILVGNSFIIFQATHTHVHTITQTLLHTITHTHKHAQTLTTLTKEILQ